MIGHIVYAVRDPEAMSSMLRGFVSLRWARRQHGRWADQLVPQTDEHRAMQE